MMKGAYVSWAVGVAGAAALIWYFGYAEVSVALAACGWGLLWVAVFRIFPLAIDAVAWSRLFADAARPPFVALLWIRWIGESINSLLPVAQVGGDVVRARMAARHGIARSTAAATVVVDFSIGIVTQIIFCLVGIGLLLTAHGLDDYVAALTMLLIVALIGATALYLLSKTGVLGVLARAIERLSGNGTVRSLAGKVNSLDREMLLLHKRRWEVLNAFVLKLGGWMARTGETYLAFRSAAFAVPGAFGVQEGGILVLGAMLGVPPETALALALVKRVREVVMGVPALVGWSLLETRALERRASERLGGSD
jgi:uncharacterized protein (TIRG00374 family)